VGLPLLTITGAAAAKADGTAIVNLQWALEEGQHWAVTGRPESAKTLILEILAGRVAITQGVIRHHHADDYLRLPSDGIYRSHHDLVCFVPFHHHFRNRSNVQAFYYQQRFNSMDADDADTVAEYLQRITPKNPVVVWTAEKAMALLGLALLANKSLITLSNGETRRLMLATALVRNPRILLLEHPLAGLDVTTRARFNDILKHIIQSGIHVILTSSPHEIPEIITHIMVVDGHTVVARGPRETVTLPELAAPSAAAKLGADFQGLLTRLLAGHNTPVSSPIVSMKDVTVIYGEKTILDNINWLIQPGEAWALRGHNGAGKSTLLSLINGDNPQAYKNNITLFGRRRGTGESIWDIKKHIGYVSPELHQYFPKHQTVLQVVLSGYFDTVGLFRQVTASQQEAALGWLQLFGLDGVARERLAQLSPDRQRLCLLARAVIKNPSLLILDEPCQGLSPQHRDLFKAVVNEIHAASGTTIIYVSHYDEDIPSCVNRTIQLEQGSVTACSPS